MLCFSRPLTQALKQSFKQRNQVAMKWVWKPAKQIKNRELKYNNQHTEKAKY